MGAPSGTTPDRLVRAFAALDRAAIAWCLLRPPAGLGFAGADVDLLVRPDALRAARDVLADEGFVPLPVAGSDLHAVDYDVASERFLWLHVQCELRIAGERVGADEVLADVVRDPLPRAGDDWLFWILVLHGLLDKGEVAARHRPAVHELAPAGERGPAPLRELARRHGLDPDSVVTLAKGARWESLSPPPGSARPQRRLGPAGQVDRAARLWSRRGVSVAVIGPDGAGKTTLINRLCASLPFETRVVYMGLTGGRLPRADALRLPGLVLVARLALLFARYGLAAYHRSRGRIVLFDRYPLDAAVPSGKRLTRTARLSRRVQGALIPPPGLVLLLDAPGATYHARKGEYDAEQLELWRAAYRRLAARRRSVEVLDATRPADIVARDAAALIWRMYRERWRDPAP